MSNDLGIAWNPWYIQYFGFTVKNGDPANNQTPQDLSCASTSGQPGGTTYSWTIPSYTYSADLKANPKEAAISDLKAISAGTNEAVICTYHWSGTLNGAVITDWPAQDDTTSIPITGTNPQQYNPDKVTGHEPGSVTIYSPKYTSQNEVHPISDYRMQLFDTGGQAMIGVFVNEHFTSYTPAGFTINGDGDFWTSLEAGEFNYNDELSWIFGYLPYHI